MSTPITTNPREERAITIMLPEDLLRWGYGQVEAGKHPSFSALVQFALAFMRMPGDPIVDHPDA